jgi:hypothetical protein
MRGGKREISEAAVVNTKVNLLSGPLGVIE